MRYLCRPRLQKRLPNQAPRTNPHNRPCTNQPLCWSEISQLVASPRCISMAGVFPDHELYVSSFCDLQNNRAYFRTLVARAVPVQLPSIHSHAFVQTSEPHPPWIAPHAAHRCTLFPLVGERREPPNQIPRYWPPLYAIRGHQRAILIFRAHRNHLFDGWRKNLVTQA